MLLTIEILIVLGLLALLSQPLFLGSRKSFPGRESELQDLLSQKETLFTAIKDLDFDYATGKLTEEDHKVLRKNFEHQASSLLKELDRENQGEWEFEDEIEKEIEALRQGKVEKVEKPKKFCSNCGTPFEKGDKFCSSCGQKIG